MLVWSSKTMKSPEYSKMVMSFANADSNTIQLVIDGYGNLVKTVGMTYSFTALKMRSVFKGQNYALFHSDSLCYF